MFEKIFQKMSSIQEDGFEYYDLKDHFDVSVNFIRKGTKVPSHTHELEVFNYVFEGEFTVRIDSEERTYSKGDWVNIPAGQIHSVEAKTKVALLELWKKEKSL